MNMQLHLNLVFKSAEKCTFYCTNTTIMCSMTAFIMHENGFWDWSILIEHQWCGYPKVSLRNKECISGVIDPFQHCETPFGQFTGNLWIITGKNARRDAPRLVAIKYKLYIENCRSSNFIKAPCVWDVSNIHSQCNFLWFHWLPIFASLSAFEHYFEFREWLSDPLDVGSAY